MQQFCSKRFQADQADQADQAGPSRGLTPLSPNRVKGHSSDFGLYSEWVTCEGQTATEGW